jgi:glycosyltransferase involved in cell wall biosynthesis
MQIGIDASRAVSFAPTGTENYSREMIKALLRIDPANQYRLYLRGEALESKIVATNVEYRSIPFPHLWTHARLSFEMLTRSPDLLWIPAHVLPLVHPQRSIVTVHDLGNLFFPDAYTPNQRAYHRWAEGWNTRAAHLFTDSESTRKDLVKFFSVSPEKITVVYPAYDDARFRPGRDLGEIELTKSRLRVDKNYIIAIGTIHPRKNYARLAQALKKLAIDDLQLVIVGKKGWLYESLMREIKCSGLPIVFLDYVAADELPALISGAKLLIFPSLHEGFGLPILEAQASGVPVVCSDSSSLLEVAGNGAIFFDPSNVDAMADAIWRGLSDDSLRAELVTIGFENVRRFSWGKSARVALDVFNQFGPK